jgi:hypothetical protein
VPTQETRTRQVTTCRTVPEQQTRTYTVQIAHTVQKEIQVPVCHMIPKTETYQVPVRIPVQSQPCCSYTHPK